MSEFVTVDEFNAYKNILHPRGNAESAMDGVPGEHAAPGNQQTCANSQIGQVRPALVHS